MPVFIKLSHLYYYAIACRSETESVLLITGGENESETLDGCFLVAGAVVSEDASTMGESESAGPTCMAKLNNYRGKLSGVTWRRRRTIYLRKIPQ